MTRPTCPRCHRVAVIANSHQCGTARVQFFGCIQCGVYDLGKQILPATVPRTRAVIGKHMRDRSGRFAIN